MDTFPVESVKKFLLEHGCTPYGCKNSHEILIYEDVTLIQIPKSGRIDFDQLDSIIIDQLGIARWEFDYWLGENVG